MEIRDVKVSVPSSYVHSKALQGSVPKDSVSIGSSERVTILHLNDIHGVVEPVSDSNISSGSPMGGIARVKRVIDEERDKNPEGTLVLNAGDVADGTMVSYLTQGKVVTEALNKMGFDAVTLGNHDFAWGQEALRNIVEGLNTPVVLANVSISSKDSPLKNIKPYIIKNVKGIKFAIIGLGTPETARYVSEEKLKGISFEVPSKAVKKYISEVRKKGADVVIVLSHLGFENDKKMAKEVDGIDVIVGGHSHTPVERGYKEGNTIIVQAGSQTKFVGRLDLEIDKGTKKIKGYRAELLPVLAKKVEPDEKILKIISPYIRLVREEGSKEMGEALEDIPYAHKEAAKLNQIFADAMLKRSKAQIGVFSSRILRGSVKKGKVTYENLYNALPFTEENLYTCRVKGEVILKELESRIVDGGRGISVPAGFKYEYDPSLPEGKRVVSAKLLDGTPLDPDKEYLVAVNDSTITRPHFKGLKDKRVIGKCQDIFMEAFKKGSPWKNDPDDRVVKRE